MARKPGKPHWTGPPAPPFYQYVHASQLPTAGAMAYGFESEMLAWRPALGPGIAARQQFASVFPTPQYFQAAAVTWLQGVSGVQHGQSALQPLSNPYST